MVKKNSTKTKVQPYEIGELDHYLFGQGNHYEIYKKMGAHEVTKRSIFCGMGSSCSKRFCNRRV